MAGYLTTGLLLASLVAGEAATGAPAAGPGQLPGLVDGAVVRTATGPNDKPGGSERLDWEQWQVAEFSGKSAALQIVDRATGGWGHINIDHIIQTERKLPVLADQQREILAERRYLNLPIGVTPPEAKRGIELFSRAAPTRVTRLQAWSLKSSWF